MIERHLMNDRTDPFNRKDLTVEMLEGVGDLKEEIERWLAAEIAKRRQEKEKDGGDTAAAAMEED